ncbi:MAG: 5'/3'-nucleotidase SurE, partial [Candidatus Thermoplasmatota archaeon]|nr:5'/3'-nucleotidase SurE [Candidatus Thermoplasmatota archaeon]
SQWNVNDENLHLIELDGTPCDTMIVALDKGLQHILPEVIPRLVISGVNLGPNMSQDSYHSGTMGAAREAGLYGMPAIASSLTSFDDEGMQKAVDATVQLIERAIEILPMVPENLRRPSVDISKPHVSRWPIIEDKPAWSDNPIEALRTAFRNGELMLNINTPPTWNGEFQTTRLGMRWYRDAISFAENADNENTATFTIGAASIDHTPVESSDCDAVMMDKSSISCLPTWPQTHPLAIDDRLLTWCLQSGEENYPIWLKI